MNSFDGIADQFAQECRNGVSPTVEQYVLRYPEFSEEIEELFPSIQMMESFGKAQHREISEQVRPFHVPEQIGDFQLVRELGRGGMGVVYEAFQQSLGRRVAIKLLRQHSTHPVHVQRFEREARTAANLHHTNIVPVFGVGSQDRIYYYVMQYIEGSSLESIIASRSSVKNRGSAPTLRSVDGTTTGLAPLVPDATSRGEVSLASRDGLPRYREAAEMILQVADALSYAHSQNTLHRDIKPGNLLVDDDGTVWVADFGLAKALENDNVSQTGDVVGTLRYMAAEQFVGEPTVRSDIYSLGLTAWEMLTLSAPFGEAGRARFMNSRSSGRISAPSNFVAGIPVDLETIVMKACEPDPADRYATAGQMAADLENFLNDRPISARLPSIGERLFKWSRRNPAVAGLSALAALLVCMVVGAVAVGWWQTHEALDRESAQRIRTEREKDKAEKTLTISLDALDQVYQQFAPQRPGELTRFTVNDDDGQQQNIATLPVLSIETASMLEEVLGFYDKLATQESDNQFLKIETARANRRVGVIHLQLGAYEKSLAAFRNALSKFENLDLGESALEIAGVHNEIGNLHFALNEPELARDSHLEAIRIIEGLLKEQPDDPGLQVELARTMYLSDKRLPPPPQGPRPPSESRPQRGKFSADSPINHGLPRHSPAGTADSSSKSNLERAIVLLEAMSESKLKTESKFLLALCYRSKGEQEKSIEILQKLSVEFPEATAYQFELAETYARLDPRLPGKKEIQPLLRGLERGVEITRKLHREHPNIPRFAQTLASNYHKLGTLYRRFGLMETEGRRYRIQMAEKHFRSAIEIQTSLLKRVAQEQSMRVWLAAMTASLADMFYQQGRYKEAVDLLEKTLMAIDSTPGGMHTVSADPPLSIDLAASSLYERLAEVLKKMGDEKGAKKAGEKTKLLRIRNSRKRRRSPRKPRGKGK